MTAVSAGDPLTPTPIEWIGSENASLSAWFVHGVMGQGRNWRTVARRWVAKDERHRRAGLIDLRNHGQHPPRDPPHTLAAAARDLETLASSVGGPNLLVGHSMGGKVVLEALETSMLPRHAAVWVLDSAPGRVLPYTPGPTDPVTILGHLRDTPTPAASRDDVRAFLSERGLPMPIVRWLLTSLHRTDVGWQWTYNLDGVEAMMRDYGERDLWPVIHQHAAQVHLVIAGRGGRYSDSERARARGVTGLHVHELPNAGHWLHVDDPDGLLALFEAG